MKKKANVADGKPGDIADVPVAQTALKPEMDDLALIPGEGDENLEHVVQRLSRVVARLEVAFDGHVRAGERRAPGRLLPRIDGEIPAHREQPRRKVVADPVGILPAQPEERLLDDIPRRLQVSKEPPRIAEQRLLVPLQRVDYPVGFWRPNHWASTGDNGRTAGLLGWRASIPGSTPGFARIVACSALPGQSPFAARSKATSRSLEGAPKSTAWCGCVTFRALKAVPRH